MAPTAERDRLAHKQLNHVVEALGHERYPLAFSLCDRLATTLLASPHWWSLGVRLKLGAAPSAHIGEVSAQLFASAPSVNLRRAVVDSARAEAERQARDWQPGDAARVLADLRKAGASLVAVATLQVFGPRWGWSAEWLAALGELREHSDLEVRLAARELWLA